MSNETTIVVQGIYQGKNLYVQNPFSSNGVGFCVIDVRVNGNVTTDETQSSAFEIDLHIHNLKVGDALQVIIHHKEGCKPKVLNPEVLKPKSTFTVTQIVVVPQGSGHRLEWKTTGENGSVPFRVEQYRWNKWVKAAETEGKGTAPADYSAPVQLHFGENQFRVAQTDYSGQPRTSQVVKFRAVIPAVTYQVTGNTITFSAPTLYEIYDQYGNIVKRGEGKTIDLTPLPKGGYYLNYDNTVGEFSKK